jgi:hypothetical protein
MKDVKYSNPQSNSVGSEMMKFYATAALATAVATMISIVIDDSKDCGVSKNSPIQTQQEQRFIPR